MSSDTTRMGVLSGLPEMHLFGVKLTLSDFGDIIEEFDRWIRTSRDPHQVCVANVHTTVMAVRDVEYRKLNNAAAVVTTDGMPLVWAAKLLGRPEARRVSGPDLLDEVCSLSPGRGYRHFFYGGAEGVAVALADEMRARYPGIEIVGACSPPFRPLTPEEGRVTVDLINESGADFLWVGLGAPKQEKWIASQLPHIRVPVQIGVGAAFDFITGRVKRAPSWMRNAGLEWVFRLSQDRRLWRRYLETNPVFLWLLLKEVVQAQRSR